MSYRKNLELSKKLNEIYHKALTETEDDPFVVIVLQPLYVLSNTYSSHIDVILNDSIRSGFLLKDADEVSHFANVNKLNLININENILNITKIYNQYLSSPNEYCSFAIKVSDFDKMYTIFKEIVHDLRSDIKEEYKKQINMNHVYDEIADKYLVKLSGKNLFNYQEMERELFSSNMGKYNFLLSIIKMFSIYDANRGNFNRKEFKQVDVQSYFTFNQKDELKYQKNLLINALKNEKFIDAYNLLSFQLESTYSTNNNLLEIYKLMSGFFSEKSVETKIVKEFAKVLNPSAKKFHMIKKNFTTVVALCEENLALTERIIDKALLIMGDLENLNNDAISFVKNIYEEPKCIGLRKIIDKHYPSLKEDNNRLEVEEVFVRRYKFNEKFDLMNAYKKDPSYDNHCEKMVLFLQNTIDGKIVLDKLDGSIRIEYSNINYDKKHEEKIMNYLFKNKGEIISSWTNNSEVISKAREIMLNEQLDQKEESKPRRKI